MTDEPERSTQEVPRRLDQFQMPFLQDVKEEESILSFHMPGHKGDATLNPAMTALVGSLFIKTDVAVSIRGNIDYLHAPQASLKEAQELAAQAYGSNHAFFLVNGSTVGNMAALWAMAGDSETVIVPRASHRSIYGGLVVSGAMPVYVEPLYHPEVGYPLATPVDRIARLLDAHPMARGVQITSPNYYGYLSDTAAIAKAAHARQMPLAVDEAHGPHLAFHPDLPETAVRLGADLIVQSMHKTLSALTQGALLHCNEGRIDLSRLAQALAILQTSSPSSPLLISMDAARMQMATEGKELLARTLALAEHARSEIRAIPGLWCYGDELVGVGGVHAYDPTKLVIRVTDLGINGLEASDYLYNKLEIQVEFAELRHIICSLTIADTEARVEHLLIALRVMARELRRQPDEAQTVPEIAPPPLPEIVLSPRQAFFARSKSVSLDRSAGHICAESIIPYPPGIPLALPGERITTDTLAYLKHILRGGFTIVGPQDTSLKTLRVVDRG